MPYLVSFISDTITLQKNDLHLATSMMVMCECLFKNKHLFIDPYLHQLLPSIITCIVANNLCDDGDHFSLRRFASKLLKHVCNTCGSTYQGLIGRITKTLLRSILDFGRSFDSLYGACFACFELGPEVFLLK